MSLPTGRPGPSSGFVGRALVKLRWVIVVAWVAAAWYATTALPTIDEAQTGALGDLVPTDAESIDTELRANELFAFPLLSRTVVVQRDPGGLSAAEQAQIVDRARALNEGELPGLERIAGALPLTNVLGAPPFSRERSTTGLTYLFFREDVRSRDRQRLASEFVSDYVRAGPNSFVGLTGVLAARDQQSDLIADKLPLVEVATLMIVLLATGLHFRSFGAPLVTIAAVAVAYLLAVRVVAAIGERLGVSVPIEVEPVMVVLLFGIITDYSIFYLSRARQALAEGESRLVAAERTVSELTPVIATAGLTVAGATAALIVADLGFFQAFGPGTALAVLIGLAVSLTFVPACLAIGGRWVFWPSLGAAHGPGATLEHGPQRSRAVQLATRHPLYTALGVGFVLLACASGLERTQVGSATITGLPEDAPAHRAYSAVAQGFAPGVLSPTMVLIEGEDVTQRRQDLRALQRRIASLPGIAQVIGPRQQPTDRTFGAVYSPTGDAARMLVVFDSDPLGARAIESLRSLRDELPGLMFASGLLEAQASLAGDTALAEETVRLSAEDLERIALAALLVVILILAVFLRALVAPLYLVAASVLALAASLGITTYVFQDLLGWAGLTYYVPFAAAVLLVALGSDYNVFLAGRIWQETRRRPLRQAVVVASTRATRAITVAGLVLALSFAALALVPIDAFRELAFVMAVGLLIDAFLVRTLLVPAVITLVGERSRWPGRFPAPEPDDAAPADDVREGPEKAAGEEEAGASSTRGAAAGAARPRR